MTSVRAITLAILCTILTTAAQILMKVGVGAGGSPFELLLNPYLLGGVFSLIVAGVLMTFALGEGELSVIHPLLALGFVWVVLAGLWIGESVKTTQYVGIGVILFGVSTITHSRRRKQ